MRPAPKATESDIEKAAQIVAAAKRREASKLDGAPKAAPRPPPEERTMADAFNDFSSRPEFVAQRAEQDRMRQERRAEILARYGSVEAVYAETEREAALRVACEPMTVHDRRPDYEGQYALDGWGMFGKRNQVPARVREAVSAAWPLPTTMTEAWAEFIAAEERESDRQAMPGRVWPAHHGLQPLQSLVAAWLLEGDADRAGQGWVGWRCGGSRTAATSGLTGLPMAGKGGEGAGHRPVAQWSNDPVRIRAFPNLEKVCSRLRGKIE